MISAGLLTYQIFHFKIKSNYQHYPHNPRGKVFFICEWRVKTYYEAV